MSVVKHSPVTCCWQILNLFYGWVSDVFKISKDFRKKNPVVRTRLWATACKLPTCPPPIPHKTPERACSHGAVAQCTVGQVRHKTISLPALPSLCQNFTSAERQCPAPPARVRYTACLQVGSFTARHILLCYIVPRGLFISLTAWQGLLQRLLQSMTAVWPCRDN